jgi:hypothetical protein
MYCFRGLLRHVRAVPLSGASSVFPDSMDGFDTVIDWTNVFAIV